MLIIIQNEQYHILPYIPDQKLSDLKNEVSKITNINRKSLILLHNNVALVDDLLQISELIADNTTLHTAIHSPIVGKNTQDLESLSKMFPQLQTEIENNKNLKEIVKTGNLQDEFNKMAKNPKYVESQMRAMDIAISKLENTFGGFNAMSSMMHDVNEPLNDILLKKEKDVKKGNKIDHVNRQQFGENKENYMLKYALQLRQMSDEGHRNTQMNLYHLIATKGDVYEAILRVLEDEEKSKSV